MRSKIRSKNLRIERQRVGWHVYQLAHALGVECKHIHRIEDEGWTKGKLYRAAMEVLGNVDA